MPDKIQKFNKFLRENLNENQLKSVLEKEGVFLVIAGAGSGKTRVITARIANLIINENQETSSIVALTFTNKAAKEMRDRIHGWIGFENQIPFIGTFHSFCLKLLKSNSHLLEIPDFTILDDDDQLKLINTIIQRHALNKKVNAKQINYQISSIKNNLTVGSVAFDENKLIQEIYLAYEHEKKINKSLDFDDLLIETIKLFRNNKKFKTDFQNKIKHVLVDEYQDTNCVQHELLKQITQKVSASSGSTTFKNNHSDILASDKKNLEIESLCIVGDEDQSIYSWRGATVDNIVHFKNDFTDTKIIKIEQNYRSVQPILEIANKVINNNKNRNPKKLWSERQAKNRVLQMTCISEYKEGEMIANAIKFVSKEKKINSIGILYRTHFQSRAIEEALIKNSIPYTIIGGIQFYERKEIKDLLGYLKLIVNPFDKISFFRVINCPQRKLGEKFEEEFYNEWNGEPLLNFIDVSKKLIDQGTLTKVKEESLLSFTEIFSGINRESSTLQTLNHIITQTNYFLYLKNNFEEKEAESKIENIKELLRAAHHFEEQGIKTIPEFLDQIALLQQKIVEEENKEEINRVQLMTLHAAKGLEFDLVIIAGLEEGIIPNNRSLINEADLEEERRLFYVGITRAKEYLIFSFVKYRNSFGQTNAQIASRFLEEIPANLSYKEDTTYYLNFSMQISKVFSEFFGINSSAHPKVLTFSEKIIPAKKESATQILDKTSIDNSTQNKWKKNQPVQHKEFGLGIIQKIETKADGKIFITTKFKNGLKKISSEFLNTK